MHKSRLYAAGCPVRNNTEPTLIHCWFELCAQWVVSFLTATRVEINTINIHTFQGAGSLKDHMISLAANKYLPFDGWLIPMGMIIKPHPPPLYITCSTQTTDLMET